MICAIEVNLIVFHHDEQKDKHPGVNKRRKVVVQLDNWTPAHVLK